MSGVTSDVVMSLRQRGKEGTERERQRGRDREGKQGTERERQIEERDGGRERIAVIS
jgi:hypothetical protein